MTLNSKRPRGVSDRNVMRRVPSRRRCARHRSSRSAFLSEGSRSWAESYRLSHSEDCLDAFRPDRLGALSRSSWSGTLTRLCSAPALSIPSVPVTRRCRRFASTRPVASSIKSRPACIVSARAIAARSRTSSSSVNAATTSGATGESRPTRGGALSTHARDGAAAVESSRATASGTRTWP